MSPLCSDLINLMQQLAADNQTLCQTLPLQRCWPDFTQFPGLDDELEKNRFWRWQVWMKTRPEDQLSLIQKCVCKTVEINLAGYRIANSSFLCHVLRCIQFTILLSGWHSIRPQASALPSDHEQEKHFQKGMNKTYLLLIIWQGRDCRTCGGDDCFWILQYMSNFLL